MSEKTIQCCPECGAREVKRYTTTSQGLALGEYRWLCDDCGHSFVAGSGV